MNFEQQYRAIASRDARFDGQFYTAVHSTGIYCRPSCPARTPRKDKVSFYPTSAAAHEAGYRACKRCLPEAVPGSPEWNLRSDTAARAMRLILDGEVDRAGVSGLAASLGYSTRQIHRILQAELGAGPLTLARATRAQIARSLLVGTDMSMTDIAFASGFASVRQFNQTISDVFALAPSAIRATGHPGSVNARHRAATGKLDTGKGQEHSGLLELRLPTRAPYDSGVFGFLAARAVSGVESANESHSTEAYYARAVALPHGHAVFSVQLPPLVQKLPAAQRPWATDHLVLRAIVQDLKDLPVLLSRVRRLFDLDADPEASDDVLHELLPGAVQEAPGIRVPGALSAEEILLRAMIGQQITVVSARGQLDRLAAIGSPLSINTEGTEFAELHRLFPEPAEMLASGIELIRGPQRRITAIRSIMEALASGELHLGVDDSLESLQEKLLPRYGIGPWTVNYLAMRLLGSPDIFPANDVAVQKGMRRLQLSEAQITTLSPWRSYATMQLWRIAALATYSSASSSPSQLERKSS